jgi:hypothetical protein
MLAIGLVLNIAVVGLFCWALLSLLVHALPLFVAISIGMAALHHGVGGTSALLAGFVAAPLTLAVCRFTLPWRSLRFPAQLLRLFSSFRQRSPAITQLLHCHVCWRRRRPYVRSARGSVAPLFAG